MINTPNKKTLMLGYISQFANMSVGIILIPILLLKLNMDEIGLWYIYLSILGFVNLLDFGFSPTITRNIAYIAAGADKLNSKGKPDQDFSKNKINYELLSSFIKAIKTLYFILGISTLVILFLITKFYILDVLFIKYSLNFYTVFSWMIFSIAIVTNIMFLYYSPILLGLGKLKENYYANIINKLSTFVLSVLVILSGFGLIGLTIAYLSGVIILRIISWHYLFNSNLKLKLKLTSENYNKKDSLKILWPNSWRMGLVSISAFFVRRAAPLIIAAYLSLEITAKYSITIQIITAISSLSLIYFNIHIPALSAFRVSGNKKRLLDIYGESIVIMSLIFFISAVVIFSLTSFNIGIQKFTNKILGVNYIIAIIIILFLESNHNISAGIISTKNEIPFTKSAVISGLLIVIFQWLVLKYSSLGLWGIIFAQGLIQLAYNNWKWPFLVLNELQVSLINVLNIGFKNLYSKVSSNFFLKRPI